MPWIRMAPSKDGRTVKAIHSCGHERWLKSDKEDPTCNCQPCATKLLSMEPVEFEAGDKGWLAKFRVPDLTTGAGQLRIAWARYLGMSMSEVYTFAADSFGDDMYGVYFQTDREPTIDERFRRVVETAATKYLNHQLAEMEVR